MSQIFKTEFFESDNLTVSPFSDLKELISRNRYKTKTKPYFLWSLLF